MPDTTITDLPNATTPLTGGERVPMDQSGTTRDASTQEIANLAGSAITAAVAAHEAAADPHPGYAQESALGTAAAQDVGTGPSNVVQLDGSSRLPAVDGSQLTNLPSGASSLDGLTDVSITGPQNDQVLKYSSGTWINDAAPGGGGGTVTSVGIVAPTGLTVSGSPVTTSGNITLSYSAGYEGFLSADKTKLNGIETGADVTDTANVTAAGALMDSEVTNLAQVKAFNSADYATAAQGTDSREWTAATIAQAEAEAGTATTRRAFTAQRVRQAVVAWWATASGTVATAAQGDLADSAVQSDPTGITGADAVANIVSLTQAEYDAIVTPDSATLYVITD